MARRLDSDDRELLEFRPNIYFIEPEVKPGVIDPIEPGDPANLQNIMDRMLEGKKLANAVNVLAAAVQARVDNLVRAKGFSIALDPNVDAAAVQALKRLHPDASPDEITYDQYRECKDRQLARGIELGAQVPLSAEDYQKARTQVAKDGPLAGLNEDNKEDGDGFKSKKAQGGGLRPELNSQTQIVEPLNIADFQISVLKMLINFLWKMFIKPGLIGMVPPPISSALKGAPNKLVGEPNDPKAENFILASGASSKVLGKEQNISAQEAAGLDKPDPTTGTADSLAPENVAVINDPFAGVIPANEFLKTQDCITITKTYERGAAYSTQEESVYALLTPYLGAQRSLSSAAIKNVESFEGLVSSAAFNSGVGAATQQAGSDPGLGQDANGNPVSEDPSVLASVADWAKDCIPCTERFNNLEGAAAKLGGDLLDALTGPFEAMFSYFKQILSQLKNILDTLLTPSEDRFGDICALWNWITNIVCVPDLRKMIAALMALLMKLALEITSIFDLLLTLVAPLMMPDLLGLTGIIQAFLNLVLAPIECIINALIRQFDKLDYRELYSKGSTNINVGVGRPYDGSKTTIGQVRARGQPVESLAFGKKGQLPAFKSPQVWPGTEWEAKNWGWSGSINPFEYKQRSLEEATREANKELDRLQRDRGLVDFANDKERIAYQKKLQEAKQKRDDAAAAAGTNFARKSSDWLRKLRVDLSDLVTSLANYLREIIDSIRGWFTGLVKELQGLLGALTGQGNTMGLQLLKKLEIIELLNFLFAIIPWLTKGGPALCENIESLMANRAKELATSTNATVITNEDGSVSIYENPDDIASALGVVTAAIGTDSTRGRTSGSPAGSIPSPGTVLDQSRQKLNSLIELTGDPVLDTTIGQVVDALVTPKKTTFKCPYTVQRSDVEQVNKWMDELNAS